MRAHRRAHQAATSACRAGRTCSRVYAKKADLVADPDEKKRIYYQVGAVYERELGDVPQAIDTYTKILELDPDDLQALSRLDVLYEQAQNWTELLSRAHARERDDGRPERGDQLPVPDRRALREAPRRRARARSSSIARSSSASPTTSRRSRALEGLEGRRRRIRSAAAAVLEPVYEAASDWPKLIRVHEVQVRTRDRRVPEGGAPPPHRAPLRGRARRPRARRSTPTRARSPLDDGNEETLGNLERLAMVVNRWPEVAELYDAELDKLAGARTRSASSSSACATRRSSRSSSRTSTAPSRATAAWPTSTPENQTRDPRARSPLRADRALGGARERSSRARPRSPSRPTRSSSSSYRLGQVQQSRLERPRRGDRRLPRRDQRRARAPARRSRRSRRSSRAASKQLEVGEILEPLYRSMGEWEKLARVYEAQLAHTAGPGGAPGRVLPARRAVRGQAPRPGARRSTCTSARSRSSRSTRSPARRRRGSRRRSTAAGRRSRTPTPTCSALHEDHERPARDRPAARADVRGRARRHREGRGDVQVRPRRRRRSTSRRSPTSIASTSRSSPGRSSRRSSRCASRRRADRARARRALRAPRRALRDAPRRPAERHPRLPADLRRARQDARRRHRGARAHLRAARARGRSSTRVYQRELENAVGRHRPRPRSARRSRTSPPTSSGEPDARDRDVEGRARPARRGPRGAPRAREPLRARSRSGRSSSTSSSASSTSRRATRTASNILTRRARTIERQARARRRGARGLEPRPRHRLREPRRAPRDRRHPAAPGRPERARRRRSTSWWTGRRRCSTARS